jgi:hypothetical protein
MWTLTSKEKNMSQQIETQEQALSVLIQAVGLAQKRGTFDLAEAGLISQAVGIFTPDPVPEESDPNPEPEASEEEAE